MSTRLALVLVVALAVPAHAEWKNPYTGWTNTVTGNQWNNPISASLDTQLYNMRQRDLMRSTSRQQPVVRHIPLSASDFRPAEAGHPLVDQLLDSVAANVRAKLEPIIDQSFALVEQGVRENNVAAAYGVALLSAQIITTGVKPTKQGMDELIATVNDTLASSREFQRMPAVERQALYENLVLTTAMLALYEELGRHNPDARKQTIVLARGVIAKLTGGR